MRDQAVILIVDDSVAGCEALESLLFPDGYAIVIAHSGEEALVKAAESRPDLILLDVMMPGMNGYQVCYHLRNDPDLSEVPIIMVTTLDDRESRLEGINAGADDFISKPVDRAELRARVRSITRLNRYRNLLTERMKFEKLIELLPDGLIIADQDGSIQLANRTIQTMVSSNGSFPVQRLSELLLPSEFDAFREDLQKLHSGEQKSSLVETVIHKPGGGELPVEIHTGMIEWSSNGHYQMIVHDITERKLSEEKLKRAYVDLEDALEQTIEGWARALELKDHETEGHTRRVTDLTVKLARKLGVDEEQIIHIRRGAVLHDIGKIGVPDRILLKPGPLDADEWKIMRLHPKNAENMLSQISFLRPAINIPLYHHELWNGEGYIYGLKGADIPLEARIFSIVDVYDALTSRRPYHEPMSKEAALEYIVQARNTRFDPDVVENFVQMINAGT